MSKLLQVSKNMVAFCSTVATKIPLITYFVHRKSRLGEHFKFIINSFASQEKENEILSIPHR